MADNKSPQNNKDIYVKQRKTNKERKTPISRRQDKRGLGSTREASNQPTCSIDEQHVDDLGGFFEQTDFMNTAPQPLEKLTLYIQPRVKQWTQRQADRLGLSLSSFASPLYAKVAQQHINLDVSPELKPFLKQEIRSELRGQRRLTAQTAHDVQMVKQLLSYLLEQSPGVGKEKIGDLLAIAYTRANEEMKKRMANQDADTVPSQTRVIGRPETSEEDTPRA